MKILNSIFTAGLSAGLLAMTTSTAFSAVSVNSNLNMKSSVYANPHAEGCDNSNGPYITFKGDITMGGVDARIIYRNNLKGTHEGETPVIADVTLVPKGEQIKFAKQPSHGGVGGNPWIYAQYSKQTGNNTSETISDNILLGRCVQGLNPSALAFLLGTSASVNVSGDCSGAGGPDITLKGKLALQGLKTKLTFTNNEKGTHKYVEDDISVEVVILDDGESITFSKKPPEGGAGGNPHLYFQFVDGDKMAMTDEIYLGRCNSIGR